MKRKQTVVASLLCILLLAQLALLMNLEDRPALAKVKGLGEAATTRPMSSPEPDVPGPGGRRNQFAEPGRLVYHHKAFLPTIAIRRVPPELPIRIDGEDQDWQAYTPSATDPQGDTTGGPHTDLKALYETADSHYLYLMVEVYDPPLLSEATIELNLDVTGQDNQHWWLHTNIGSDGAFRSWTDRDQDGELETFPITGAEVAWGNVMELRLPLAHLGGAEHARTTFVNFWRDVDGQWTWVDFLVPERP